MSSLHAVVASVIDPDKGGTSLATLMLGDGDASDLAALPAFAVDPEATVTAYDDAYDRLLVVIRQDASDRLLAAPLPD